VDNRSCGGGRSSGLFIEAIRNLQDMCGADIPDVSELEGTEKGGDKKRSECKDPDKTPVAPSPAGD
jgi:hypothetical protein